MTLEYCQSLGKLLLLVRYTQIWLPSMINKYHDIDYGSLSLSFGMFYNNFAGW